MFSSIKSKIFISHLFLIILLLGGLSYKHYRSALNNYIDNVTRFYTDSSSSIVTTSSLAIAGLNYGNIQLPSFIQEISNNKKLLYFNIIGLSDYTSKDFNAVYSKEYKTIYRNEYPTNYQELLTGKLERFRNKLDDPSSDKVKLNFLIARTKDKLEQYKQNKEYAKKLGNSYTLIQTIKSPYIDFDNNLLYLSLKTHNKNGGTLFMVFDISEIKNIKFNILKNLAVEAFLALFLSIVVLNILSNRIIGPLNELSTFMSNDFQNLNTNDIPGLNQKDEIGVLSKAFKFLIEEVHQKQIQIEHKAYFDGLTGVYNRNKFEEIFHEEIQRAQRYHTPLSIAIIDIDKFKNVNDTFGHLMGDEILIMIAQKINSNIRNTDIFARWGGEEFIILFKETSAQTAKEISEKLKDKIQEMEHKIAGNMTASFGITQYVEGDTMDSIFKRCDEALYRAKDNGRNRVEVESVQESI